ncbi:MAG: pyruvate kinase, partial [Deltaproteobacteria bacterium]|nr:pyruvate kinase [Deltaproteobacteria bacterium]
MSLTKIICTIGPACDSEAGLLALIQNGMNVARLNFSHGTHAEHREKIDRIRAISEKIGKPIAILQDLCGPKIRIADVKSPGIQLTPGQTFTLTTACPTDSNDCVTVSYGNLPNDVKPGDRILLADGMMELVVERIKNTDIHCKVVIGGLLTSHKGINLPTRSITAPAITEKDKLDLKFGLACGVDYVALSFVRAAADIHQIKSIIHDEKKDTPVIAKIEKHEALGNIDDIMSAADGIMVARGDLGVEIPPENVPNIQKMLVKKANVLGKPVIIATQMLRSMVDAPRPTRAEAADVANAVFEGADAIMLSEETATGSFPDQAVAFMARIAESAEREFQHDKYLGLIPKKEMSESVAHASCVLADHLDAAAVIATTRSGATARYIARFRPRARIIALSPDLATVRRLSLVWGCIPHWVPGTKNTDEMIENAAGTSLESGMVKPGDLVVIT